ncbi:MAG: alpha/beta fold hydrolase [Candidatus Eremiobacteraeota bacterium]|nr:alpha/beta fold hydrolase [Candidatus Eremiobacteraeota bacterium]
MHITVDDVTINLIDAGSGDAIVLLHGFPFSHEIWEAQIGALASTHRVIAPDCRGLGASGVTPGPYLMETLASDVAALLDALRVERATLVGHSLGGYVALAFFRMFRERVERLALVCSRFSADDVATAKSRYELADRLEKEGSEALVDAYAGRVLAPGADARIAMRITEIARAQRPGGAAAVLRGMAQRVSSEDLIDELDLPALLVAGKRDVFVSRESLESVRNALPHAKLVACERSAHLPMLEEPAELTRVLEEFVRPSSPRGG